MDDLIVLSHGKKIYTSRMEWLVQEHPLVRTALIGGHGRPRPFLLVELVENIDETMFSSKDTQRAGVNRI